MADDGEPQGRIEHPNRKKAASKVTRTIVLVLLVASAFLVAVITWGGWGTLEGAKPVQIGYILVYLVLAYMVLRWSRGALPLAAALAIILLIFAAVSGPQWYDRDKPGFTSPTLDESILGLLSFLLIPLQLLLIAFAMRGFQQAWNVEIEHPPDHEDDERDERRGRGGDPSPAPA